MFKEHTSNSVHRGIKWEAGSGRDYKAEDLGNRRILQIFSYHSGKLEFCHVESVKGLKWGNGILII